MKAFECNMCGACCSNLGNDQVVLLLHDDIAAMARSLEISEGDVMSRYCEVNEELSERASRRILQLTSIGGRCVFLRPDNKCGIHAFKPFQCQHGPDRLLQ